MIFCGMTSRSSVASTENSLPDLDTLAERWRLLLPKDRRGSGQMTDTGDTMGALLCPRLSLAKTTCLPR